MLRWIRAVVLSVVLLVVLSWVRALDLSTAAVTGALSKPSGTPAAGGTGDLPPKAATPRTMTSWSRRPLSSADPVPDDWGGKGQRRAYVASETAT